MAKSPAFQFYTADWFIDTAQMSRAAKGLHIDLLSIQWSNGFIEADEFGFPLGLSESDLGLFKSIKHKYRLEDGKLINDKLEENRAAKRKFAEKQHGNGSKGGRPKKIKPDESQFKGNENPDKTQNEKINNPKITQKNPLEDEDIEDEDIEELKEGGVGEENENSGFLVPTMLAAWKRHVPGYPEDREKDFEALQRLARFFANRIAVPYDPLNAGCVRVILAEWEKVAEFVSEHHFFKNYSLAQVQTHSQNILQSLKNGNIGKTPQPGRQLAGVVESDREKDYGKL